MNDGHLQEFYKQYRQRLDFVAGIGLSTRLSRSSIESDLVVTHKQLLLDKEFAIQGKNLEFFDLSTYFILFRAFHS